MADNIETKGKPAKVGLILPIGFATILAVLIISAIVSYRSTRDLLVTRDWVQHSERVMRRMDQASSNLLKVDAAVRGYAIHGQTSYLATLEGDMSLALWGLSEAKNLTVDRPSLTNKLARLQPMIQDRFKLVRRYIQIRRDHGLDAATAAINTETSLKLRAQITNLLDNCQAQEKAVLVEREQRSAASTRTATFCFWSSTVAGVMLLVGFYLIAAKLLAAQYQFRLTEGRRANLAEDERDRFFDLSLDMLCISNSDGYFKRVSPAFTRTLGWSVEEMLTRPFIDFVHPDDKEATIAEVDRQVKSGGEVLRFENRYAHKNGSWRTLSWRSIPQAGGVMFATARDTTERKGAEEEASRQIERLLEQSSLLALSHDAILVRDMNDLITFWNMGAELTYGWTKEDAIGQVWHSLLKTQFPIPLDEIQRNLVLHGSWEGDLTNSRKDGKQVLVEVRKALLRDEQGQPRAIMEIHRDITKRIQAVEVLRSTTEELVHSNEDLRSKTEELVHSNEDLRSKTEELVRSNEDLRSKTEELVRSNEDLRSKTEELVQSNDDLQQFANVASHDLQEPLRMVASFLQLLEKKYKGQLDEQAGRWIDHAVDGATRMQALIQDLLSFARLGSHGKEFTPCDMTEILSLAQRNLHHVIEESDAKITFDALPTLHGDKPQLVSLFQNLIGNAIKYRGEQPPCIHVSATFDKGSWLFSVKDNGIGFAPEYAERIFIIFQRLHVRTRYAGTGIGLALCKRIVERHDGSIWTESEVGCGSTFFFNLSAEQPEVKFDSNELEQAS